MFDTNAFSNIFFKLLGYLSSRVFIIWALAILAVYIFLSETIVFGYVLMLVVWSFPFAWFVSGTYNSRQVFIRKNKIQPYFSGSRNRWSVIGKQIQSLKRSTYLTHILFGKYGENTYSLPIQGQEVPFLFTGNSGVVAWLKLDSVFPHIVIDSLANKRLAPALLRRNLPTQSTKLEGNFPDYFKVYYEPNQQNIMLRILTPDRMAALIDNLHTFNIEVQGNYLRIYVDHAQHSADDFTKFIEMLELLGTAFKVGRLSRMRI